MSFAEKNLDQNDKLIYQARISLWAFHKYNFIIILSIFLLFFSNSLTPDSILFTHFKGVINHYHQLSHPTISSKIYFYISNHFFSIYNFFNKDAINYSYLSYIQVTLISIIFLLVSFVFLKIKTTELALTNKKIVLKKGIIAIKTLELELNKVGAIHIYQSFLGRILNFGTLLMTGAGLPQASMKNVHAPMKFRIKFLQVKQSRNKTSSDNISINPQALKIIDEFPMPEKIDLMPQAKKTKIGKYEILEKISKDNLGTSYLAFDSQLKRQVVLKLLEDSNYFNKFMAEAEHLAKLEHQNIINIFDFGHHNDSYYIVFENFKAQTLKKILPNNILKDNEKINILKQILLALENIHKNQLIHRNLKSENILYNREQQIVKIIDFSIAKELQVNNSLGQTQNIVGTPNYMSPEHFKNNLDSRSDLFSFGIVFYELFSNKLPFGSPNDNLLEIMNLILNEEPKPIENLNPNLQKILNKCLEKNKDDRYQSAREIIIDLNNI